MTSIHAIPAMLVLLISWPMPILCAQEQEPLRLTIYEAIQRALQANLDAQSARADIEEAHGKTIRTQSILLPHISAEHASSFQNRNLNAFGISVPGIPIPSVVGPLGNYDYRLFASQTVIDRQAYHDLKAARYREDAARHSESDTREAVVRQTAGLYLNAEAALAEQKAAEARVSTSQSLAMLAHDQHETGLATGVDVLRAQVQLQHDRQALLAAQDSYQSSLLELEQYIGVDPGTPMTLVQTLSFRKFDQPLTESFIDAALASREDFKALLLQERALVEDEKASHARYLPKLGIDGNYGALGRSYGSMTGTGMIEGTVSVTLFDRDRTGEASQIEARLAKVNAQKTEMRRAILLAVQKASLDLHLAEQQVQVAQSSRELSQRELDMAKDRFRNGVTDNLEVISAQNSLQESEENYILALAKHEDAKFALIRALGGSEASFHAVLDATNSSTERTNP